MRTCKRSYVAEIIETYLLWCWWDGTKRIPFLENEPEMLLKINGNSQKTNPSEPKNKAGKLLKTRSCGKNEPKTNPKTNPAMLLKINEGEKRTKNKPERSPTPTVEEFSPM